jgi:hypothetical protein
MKQQVPEGRDAFALQVLVTPYGREPVPENFNLATARFDTATAEYERGDYEMSVQTFLSAAQALRDTGEHPYATNFSDNRLIIYRNIAWASLMAKAADLGRTILRQAAVADAECAAEIEAIIDQLLSEH